ncbi:MAG: hypothetical protein A4E56_00394 [Pelotomaculum sp. PtaU1.Bin065]|nr:MAG: hypothetical protein A4E56_00394 [Pelotomaculum sp. PtaU1.Bin065]
MKKFLALVLFLAVAVIYVPWLHPAKADQVNVYQDNQLVKSVVFKIGVPEYVLNGQTPGTKMDVAPFVENDRTFVPVRFLGNALGISNDNITWDNNTQTATIKGTKATLQMTIDKAQVVSNNQAKTIDVAPILKSDRTFLPARYVAEGLGYQVAWDDATQTVVCWPTGEDKPDVSAAVDYLVEKNQDTQTTTDYTDVNGYRMPLDTDLHFPPAKTVDMSILVLIYKPLDKQYEDLNIVLKSKFDSEIVDQILAYTKQKTERNQEILSKKWTVDEYSIEVASLAGDTGISIIVRDI